MLSDVLEYYDDYDYEDDYLDELEEPYWTVKRIVFTLVTVLLVIAFLGYAMLPFIQATQVTMQPVPPPPVTPPPMI